MSNAFLSYGAGVEQRFIPLNHDSCQEGEVICMAGELVTFSWWAIICQAISLVFWGSIMGIVVFGFGKNWKGFFRKIFVGGKG